jgi:hypothetical protein
VIRVAELGLDVVAPVENFLEQPQCTAHLAAVGPIDCHCVGDEEAAPLAAGEDRRAREEAFILERRAYGP